MILCIDIDLIMNCGVDIDIYIYMYMYMSSLGYKSDFCFANLYLDVCELLQSNPVVFFFFQWIDYQFPDFSVCC